MTSRFTLLALLIAVVGHAAADHDYPIRPVSFANFAIADGFWAPRMKTHKDVTIPHSLKVNEWTQRIGNFTRAAGLQAGGHRGMFFNDSDLYKTLEGAAYSLTIHPDPDLEAKVDDIVSKIVKSQWQDGYLFTFFSLPERRPEKRWKDYTRHELYCAGHFFEFAVAYHEATGKRVALDCAIRLADHIDSVFGPGKLTMPPGHQEIEIALARLYRATEERRYLDLAKFFLDVRGNRNVRDKLHGEYSQDHMPVVEQREAVGHVVRAVYMYTGMADVAALSGDTAYVNAIGKLWANVAHRKTYITGGVGSMHRGESFGADYYLPNRKAYAETCAAIGNALWNHRMFLTHGEGKYMDLVERVVYNGFLAGSYMEGGGTFYTNPLTDHNGRQRNRKWPKVACCPSNECRFMPSIMGYVYAHRNQDLYVNLFINGKATVNLPGNAVTIGQESNYPWDGTIKLTVHPEKAGSFALRIRIPRWASNEPFPGDLYTSLRHVDGEFGGTLAVNGKLVPMQIEKGYAVVKRDWRAGDVVALTLPMRVRRVISHPNVRDNVGRTALMRGPLVYCAEGHDNGGVKSGESFDFELADDAALDSEHRDDLLGGVTVLTGKNAAGDDFLAIPYYAWAHRGPAPMRVWLKRHGQFKFTPKAVASMKAFKSTGDGKFSGIRASYAFTGDSVTTLLKSRVPDRSGNAKLKRWTSWPQKGTSQWVQIDLGKDESILSVNVFWYDDNGGVKVPKTWHVQSRRADAEDWQPYEVYLTDDFATVKDIYNKVKPEKELQARYLRINMEAQPNACLGILSIDVETE